MTGGPAGVEISTCAVSLLDPGVCCVDGCNTEATLAVLTANLVEHTRCPRHGQDEDLVASKPLVWDPLWR